MTRKSIYIPLSLFCMTQVIADSNVIQIPEGKITDYHCVHPDITPAAGPRVIDGIDVFIAGDYLYWTAREDNLEYASTGYTNDSTTSVSSGLGKTPSFHYRSGFKAELGFNFGHDAWDTLFNYTWFQSNNNKSSITADYDDGLTPSLATFINLGVLDFFNGASTNWSLHFNTLDWELGRNCYISKYVSLRPFVGLKGSWQKQTFHNQYEGEISDAPFSYNNSNSCSYWGVGIRSGLNTSWHLSGSWSLFGDLALSALWSTFHSSRQDSYSISHGTPVDPVKQKENVSTLSPVLELSIGLRKDCWFFQDRLHISAQAGWEEQVWWDINRLPLDFGFARGGNLYLQGLTARLRLDF